MDIKGIFGELKGRLIVSCQALEDEPLHGSDIMAKMAIAARSGGASGIRANSKEDIIAIKQVVNLPIIGLVKRDYKDSDIYITPTIREIDELIEAEADIVAIDATSRKRPCNESLSHLIDYLKNHGKLVMADISTFEEGIKAEEMGVDCLSTTLSGYTPYSPSHSNPDFELVEKLVNYARIPVFAEGKITTPDQARHMIKLGAYAVVVGSAITRPQCITERFVQGLVKDPSEKTVTS